MCRYLLYAAVASALVLLTGCRSAVTEKNKSVSELSGFGTLDPMRAGMLQKRAADFTQAMAHSFRTGDFQYWRKVLEKESPPGKALIVDEKKFKQMSIRLKNDWGTLTKCSYLGELDQSIMRDFIWKCTFESPDSDGKTIRLEELFVVRCTLLRGKAVFTNFGFRFFNNRNFRRQVSELKKAEVQKNEKIN
ncbi:MAG: hypothetical protein IKA87_06850 [Lentisphaeria bacterium]|nr:hypothetical protein [Lentisphaeria bacterium]